MPLSFADLNSVNTIKKIGGSKEQQRHLENLGFVPVIVVVSKTNGNVIVNVKEVRIAISEELARKIMV